MCHQYCLVSRVSQFMPRVRMVYESLMQIHESCLNDPEMNVYVQEYMLTRRSCV
jgi:hypothetical protein